MLTSYRACVSGKLTDPTIRCRNKATNGCHCAEHVEKNVPAPAPQLVLVKCKVNERLTQRLEDAGIRWQERDEQKLDVEHARMAEEARRSPTAIREKPDSGTPVFGPEGAHNVRINGLIEQLEGAGLRIKDVHLYWSGRPEDRMNSLVFALTTADHADQSQLEREVVVAAAEVLTSASWEHCHVWANGKNRFGQIAHTVNLSHRKDTGAAECVLDYNGGLWDLKAK